MINLFVRVVIVMLFFYDTFFFIDFNMLEFEEIGDDDEFFGEEVFDDDFVMDEDFGDVEYDVDDGRCVGS